MKILVATSTYPRWPDDDVPGFVDQLSRELVTEHDVSVLAPHYHGAATAETIRFSDKSIRVYRFRYFISPLQKLAYGGGMLTQVRGNFLNAVLVPFFLLAELMALRSLQRKQSFDVIHAHWIIPQGLCSALFTTLSRHAPPYVITAHGGDLFALRGAILTRLKKWVLDRAIAVTVVSEAMREQCVAIGIPANKIIVRSMGVDLRKVFTPGDTKAPRYKLVFVGRLVEKKGVSVLLKAMSLLRDAHPQAELTIIGDGPDRKSLQAMAKQLGLGSTVEFRGSVINRDLPQELRNAAIAVMPSIVARSGDQEGLGLVAIEAMGCGCAVVATDLPAIRDSVRHEETGLIARAGDANSLATQISRLLDDDQLRRRLATDGREFAVANFDWSIVGAAYREILSDV